MSQWALRKFVTISSTSEHNKTEDYRHKIATELNQRISYKNVFSEHHKGAIYCRAIALDCIIFYRY